MAVWDGRSLLDYAIDRPGLPGSVGDVIRGRITAKLPAMAGAFVDLGLAGEGFLPDSAGGIALSEGAAVLIKIIRTAHGGKGPRVTARLDNRPANLVTAGAPGLLLRGPSAIERLAEHYPASEILIDDPGVAATLTALSTRTRIVSNAFEDEELRGEVDALAAPTALLPGGVTLHVYPTPALVALDVDLGRATSGKQGKSASQWAANSAIIPAIAKQIRLRNLGGAILLDFGGLAIRKRQALAPLLQRALQDDPLAPKLLGFTALGLAEMLRPRAHPPLHELLGSAHAAALAALRACEAGFRAAPGRRPVLRVSAAIAGALHRDRFAIDEFARRTGHRIAPMLDPSLAELKWRVGG